tara:strand:- start:397 stop:1695 length:1299 start_codon:yes stop_codon:yes gene_type:complete
MVSVDLRHKSVKTFIVCMVCGLTYGGSTFASFKTGGTGSGAAIATTSSDIQGYFPNVAENADEAVTAAQNGTLTKAQIDEVLGGMSATSSVDLNNAVNLDYVQHCITQLSSPNAGSVASCASNATTSGVAQFELGEIAGGGYPTSQLSAGTLQTAGAVSNASDYAVVSGNYCGPSGTSSCVSVLQGALSEASFSATPTINEINTWVQTVITNDLQAQANAFTPTNPSDAPGCQASVSLAAPGACNHPSWTCTTTTTDVSMLDTDSNGHPETASLDASAQTTGVKNYTIRRTLTFYGGNSYFKDHSYSINLTLASNTAYDFISRTRSNSIPKNCYDCPTGYRMATKAEAVSAGYPSPDAGWYTDQTPLQNGGATDHCYFSSGSGGKCSSGTCGSYVQALGWCNNSSLCINGKGWTSSQYSKSFYCVSINPTCN